MPTFNVTLAKAYLVTVEAGNAQSARDFAEFFTGDIQNLATLNDEQEHHCKIERIECVLNEATDAEVKRG